MGVEAIAGQPRVADQLRRAIVSGRIAHAYAFVGPPGSGRTTAALAFAGALLCERGGTGCDRCRGCRLAAARRHPDLHVVEPTPPEGNPRGARAIRIAAIREIERQASLRPAVAARKLFVLDDADRMTGEAPHAFLKTLEEPPARTVMILVLSRARAIPATVLSRCQLVRFQPRPDPRVAAERAEALALLDEVRTRGVDALLRRAQATDRERAERLVDTCWLLARDLLVARCGAPATLLLDPGSAATVAREAEAWTDEGLFGAVALCREARRALAVNVTPRLTFEVLVSRLADRAA